MKSRQQRERAQLTLSSEVGYVTQAARRPAARRPGVPEHLLGRDVEPRLPDGVPAVQRAGRHRVRARVPAAEAGAGRRCSQSGAPLVTLESQTPVARLRRLRVLGVVRVGLRQRPHAAAAGRHAAARRRTRPTRHPLVVIGGAVTFVNPEPLALFADVIAAGEGEVAGARPASRRSRGRRSRATCSRRLAQRARLLRPVVLRAAVRTPTARSPRYVPTRRHRRAAAGAQGGAEDDRSGRSAGDRASSRPTPSSARASSIEVVRGCANLCRFCWAGYNYLPVRAFPDRSHPASSRAAARPHVEPRRPGVDRALRSPGHRAHPRAA